jgi:SAM-dependent methyltransferase
MQADHDDEARAVAARYGRRAPPDRYSPLQADVLLTLQERQRVLVDLLLRRGITDLSGLRLAEVGCGSGGNLLDLLRLGFSPQYLQGLELLPDRHAQARAVLPMATDLWLGDATHAPIAPGSLDLVLQSTVFTSLLDDQFQRQLASAMWQWVKPGGAVLWYDFVYNNPRNPDVRGVPMSRVGALFPQALIEYRRVTLAPPLARAVCRVHPALYGVCNAVPWLRTHVWAWVGKPPTG